MQELPGTLVVARARRRRVLEVVDHGSCRSVHLSGPPPAGALTLLSPFDRLQPIASSDLPKRGGRRRAMAACAATLRRCHDAGELRTAVDASIDLLDHQLEPALAVVRGEAVRVLLADEVGLGKTIQAGLILSELRAARALTRALILTPAGLRDQWARELRDRFGLEAVIVDAASLASLGRSLPSSVNPWTLPGVVLASIDLLKRDELLPQIETVTWDAVVVDEAHHATPGTDRHAAASIACCRAHVVILITATPHRGDSAAFATLCDLGGLPGDPAPIRVFRRTRAAITLPGKSRRRLIVTVRQAEMERTLHAGLDAYTTRVWREAGPNTGARLAMIVLRKRALSGPASLGRSLARRLQWLGETGAGAGTTAEQLPLDFGESVGGELIPEDAEPTRVLGAEGLADRKTERELLAGLLRLAAGAAPHASKASVLERTLARTSDAMIVFTEYRDTLEDLRLRFETRIPLATLHGGMLRSERLRALSAFNAGAVRLLLATDAAAEGLNLHHCCRWVLHYEAPWSSARLEQRNGRVDRLGQSRRVHIWHLVADATEESSILSRLEDRAVAAACALAEHAVAQSVFEAAPPEMPAESAPAVPPSGGRRERQRLAQLRRIKRYDDDGERPVLARVKRRTAFVSLAPGEGLQVFRADVMDATGLHIARLAVGVRARDAQQARTVARKHLGRAARRTIALHRLASAAHGAREQAVARAILSTASRPVQAALFDRRAIVDAEHHRGELARVADELSQRISVRHNGHRRYFVAVTLVSAFRGR